MLKQNPLGIFCLIIAVIALGLAVIPGIALDRPVQIWPQQEPPPQPPPPPPSETKGGVTLRYKGISVNVGGHTKPVEETVEEPVDAATMVVAEKPISPRDHWLKCFTLAAAGCSLLALVLGPFAWLREKHEGLPHAISGPALIIAAVALTWQYIAFGIAVAVTVVVILFLLSMLG